MPKKSKKYYRNISRPASTANPVVTTNTIKPSPAPARVSASAAKPNVMVTSQTVVAELKVIGIVAVAILAAIIILSIVLH